MKVLIVEDEPRFAAMLGMGLRAEGFVVVHAANGVDGLWEATENSFDVIVLDIMLPGINGYEVLREIRARKVWTPPVLMLTAKDGDYDQADAFDLGADDYLSKPVSFVVLVARYVRSFVAADPPTPSSAVGRHVVTRPRPPRRATRSDHDRVDSTGVRSARIPHAAQGHRGHEGRHLGTCLGRHYAGPDNVVEVYVGYLRRKIDAPFGTHTIHTVRGVGYRLDSDEYANGR